MRSRPGPRSFDPRRVGALECEVWVAYYRRNWGRLLWASLGLVRTTFALPWRATMSGTWLVGRGQWEWAAGHPDRGRRTMERFYALLLRHHGGTDSFDPARSADSPLIAEVRAALVRSYAALLAAVHRA